MERVIKYLPISITPESEPVQEMGGIEFLHIY